MLDAGSGEAFAIQELDEPIQERATFRLKYRSATNAVTKNACFCFGSSAENNALFKAGTMMGMSSHGVFQGGWGNVRSGTSKRAAFDSKATFEVEATLDLEHSTVTLTIGETTIKHKLPSTLESVTHVGIYAKATQSEFTLPVQE